MMDLSEFPDDYDEPAPNEAGNRPTPSGYLRDLRHAVWAAEVHQSIVLQRLEIAATAAARIDRIRRWADDEDARLRPRQGWFAAILEDYARRVRARDPKQTKVHTPYGVIKTVKVPQRFDIDTDAALKWADQHHKTAYLIHEKTERKVYKTELTQTLAVQDGQVVHRASGEVVPWATVVPESLHVDVIPELPKPETT